MRIAISGHRKDALLQSKYSEECLKTNIENVIYRLKKEYKEKLIFNLGGAQGIDNYFGEICLNEKIRFHLYLPFHPKIHTKFWDGDEKKIFDCLLKGAIGIDIVDPDPNQTYKKENYFVRNNNMINEASFLIAFWVGKKRGGTFHAMNYALNQSKFVFNALNEMKLVFKEDLNNGWTPPTMGNK
jgi:hypothetical protein